MSSGGGGSTSKQSQVTEIKAKDPTIVQDYLSPDFLRRLTDLADVEKARALESRALSQQTTNRILGMYGKDPLYDPLQERKPTGEVTTITPNLDVGFRTEHLVPNDSFFKSPNETNYRNLYEEQKKTNENLAESVRQLSQRVAAPAISKAGRGRFWIPKSHKWN